VVGGVLAHRSLHGRRRGDAVELCGDPARMCAPRVVVVSHDHHALAPQRRPVESGRIGGRPLWRTHRAASRRFNGQHVLFTLHHVDGGGISDTISAEQCAILGVSRLAESFVRRAVDYPAAWVSVLSAARAVIEIARGQPERCQYVLGLASGVAVQQHRPFDGADA
jgi:hypothetical protein